MNSMFACPLCGRTQKSSRLLDLKCGNLDGSLLYETIKVRCCDCCGHVYNELSEKEYANLQQHYQQDYPAFDLQTPNTNGDRPGGFTESSLKRYAELHDIIKPHINPDSIVLDIGCAQAGFLRYLKNNGYTSLYGLDCSAAYVAAATLYGITAHVGTAADTHIKRNSVDCVVIDQVLEHVINVAAVFKEVYEVLKEDGVFCVSVPNAQAYSDCYTSDFYWLAMREHLQHFDREHLLWVAQQNGFYLKAEKLNAPTFFPNCIMVFGKSKSENKQPDCFKLKKIMQDYIVTCFEGLEQKRAHIRKLMSTPFYIWGIGQEFLLLYANTDLCDCQVLGLIDDTPSKQGRVICGKVIYSVDEVLKHPNTSVMITVFGHTTAMKNRLQSLGFTGNFIEL